MEMCRESALTLILHRRTQAELHLAAKTKVLCSVVVQVCKFLTLSTSSYLFLAHCPCPAHKSLLFYPGQLPRQKHLTPFTFLHLKLFPASPALTQGVSGIPRSFLRSLRRPGSLPQKVTAQLVSSPNVVSHRSSAACTACFYPQMMKSAFQSYLPFEQGA